MFHAADVITEASIHLTLPNQCLNVLQGRTVDIMASSSSLPDMTVIMSSRLSAMESRKKSDSGMTDLRNRLLSQKWFLSKWIQLKRNHLKETSLEVKKGIKLESNRIHRKQLLVRRLLDETGKRVSTNSSSTTITTTPEILRKGICCFVNDSDDDNNSNSNSNQTTSSSLVLNGCSNPALPFTRHCLQHILYNVDQQLFTRCTAKDPLSLTQCSRATFDIERKEHEPLCLQHALGGYFAGDISSSSQGSLISNGKTVRKRSKQMPLLRPGRRKKRGKGKGGNNSSTDSLVVTNNQGSTASNSTVNSVIDGNHHHPHPDVFSNAQLIQHLQGDHLNGLQPSFVVQMPPPPPYEAAVNADHHLNHNHNINDMIPPGLDVGIPVNLNPGDEALVASLVDDLPPLDAVSTETDLTEVLNKIQSEDGFNELFQESVPVNSTSNHHSNSSFATGGGLRINSNHHQTEISCLSDNQPNNNPTPVTTYSFIPHNNIHLNVHHNHNNNLLNTHAVQHHHQHAQQLQPPLPSLQMNDNRHPVHHPHQVHQQLLHRQQSRNHLRLPLNHPPQYPMRHQSIPHSSSTPVANNMTSSVPSLGNNNDDLCGLANNILDFLTTEQQQQLNGLIDGALASGSLTSSPTTKHPPGLDVPSFDINPLY